MKKSILLSLVLGSLLVACKSTPIKEPEVEDKSIKTDTSVQGMRSPKVDTTTDNTAVDTTGVKEVKIDANASNAINPLKDPNNPLSKRQVFFDYDSYVVKDEYRTSINAHAKYLQEHPNAKMIIQGNADERGTREYNLALGQKRAVAVKKAINLQGVNDSQIETVSYGEEKASANCRDDACFQQDRRAEIVYEGE